MAGSRLPAPDAGFDGVLISFFIGILFPAFDRFRDMLRFSADFLDFDRVFIPLAFLPRLLDRPDRLALFELPGLDVAFAPSLIQISIQSF